MIFDIKVLILFTIFKKKNNKKNTTKLPKPVRISHMVSIVTLSLPKLVSEHMEKGVPST